MNNVVFDCLHWVALRDSSVDKYTWIPGNIGNMFEWCKVLSFVASGAIYFNLSSDLLTCNPNSYLQATFYTIKTKQAIGLRVHCYARETGRAEAFVWSPLP